MDYPRLVDIVLPSGGTVVQMVEAYFDESGTHDGSPVMCIGSFIIESEAAKALDRDWVAMLCEHQFPYFHATDCANGTDIFKALTMQQRTDASTNAIGLIRKYMINGRMVSLAPLDFATYAPDHP